MLRLAASYQLSAISYQLRKIVYFFAFHFTLQGLNDVRFIATIWAFPGFLTIRECATFFVRPFESTHPEEQKCSKRTF
jgi:hypothetical protein